LHQQPLRSRRRKRADGRGGREVPRRRVPSHGFPVAAVVYLLRSLLAAGGMVARGVLLALLALRPHGALPPASASCHRLTPTCPARRGLSACPRAVAALSGGAGWARRVVRARARRCGESGESREHNSASSFLQSKGSVSLLGNRKLFFDTHALVCLLEENGFTTQQSEVIVSAFVKIVNTNLDMIYKDMVTKVQQEIALQQVMSHIGGLKKDMIILEKSEFSALRSENEVKISILDLWCLFFMSTCDEITKVRADNKLNLNLEKSRVKELHAQQDRALTQTDRKIDTEVADLKTMLESHKLDNIKYLAGSVFTCLTVALGFYRLWM
uniref:Mitochondrial calcium uniporter regulator 1 n=1 Tax=Pavo cristatus TaxID=9049 RepID=A0A8C9EJB5_PAVCR